MNSERQRPETFWFPVKRYGWGWGPPVRWQGWVVLAAYAALLYVGFRYLEPERHPLGVAAYVFVLTALLVVVVATKGEHPVGWRWGKK